MSIIPVEGEPFIYIASGDYRRARQAMRWVAKNRLFPLPTLEDEGVTATVIKTLVKDAFSELGITKGSKVGIDLVSYHMVQLLHKEFPQINFDMATDVVRRARMVKTPEEIQLLRTSAVISDEAMMAGIEAVKHGVREYELAAKVVEKIWNLGGENYSHAPMICSGERICPLHRMTTDRILRPGDMVFFDLGANFNGYITEFARTVLVPGRKPTALQKKVYQTVYAAIMKVISMMVPGAKSTDINAACRKVTRDAGFGEGYQGILGHSIGTCLQEPPYVGESLAGGEYEFILQPGMIFAMEPGIFPQEPINGEYVGTRIEDVILVTEKGNEVITKTPYCEELLG
jgi:Xaa-Pro aminopeptidase